MKKLSQVIVCIAAVATTGLSSVASAESPLTGNVGFSSDYLWRGKTQTNDLAAVSGGIDYAHSSGFYIGTWESNLSGGQYEQDLYAGFGGKVAGVSYDISYIDYMYPVGKNVKSDFQEVMLKLGYGPVTLTYAPTVGKEDGAAKKGDVYMSLAAKFEVKKDLMVGVLYGKYDYEAADVDAANSDYTHVQLSLSKGEFSVAYDVADPAIADPDGIVDSPRFTVSWKKSFDL